MGVTDPNVLIDHCDGDGLNNRRGNLRRATKAQNGFNQRVHKDNSAGLKGVTWHKQRQKYHARISVNGKPKSLGLFTDKIEAARAYDKAAGTYAQRL